MKKVELKPRDFHCASASAQPIAAINWDAHFAWLANQPKTETNPVDELRERERR